jgi:hypothetical protein
MIGSYYSVSTVDQDTKLTRIIESNDPRYICNLGARLAGSVDKMIVQVRTKTGPLTTFWTGPDGPEPSRQKIVGELSVILAEVPRRNFIATWLPVYKGQELMFGPVPVTPTYNSSNPGFQE